MPRITVLGPAPAPSRGKPARAAARWPHYQKYDVEVAPSPIDGQGVFAAEPIAAGVKIGEIRGEPLRIDEARIRATRYERVMMVEVSSKRAIDFHRSTDPMRYTNHACEPNARLSIEGGRVEFFSLRPIAQGEEITVRYGETHHQGRLSCRCGAPNCQGKL
jgi:SET domain-containing protein